jgi:hypothetical protein
MSPHRNIRKFTWTSPQSKALNQIEHILIDRRRAADCDTDRCLVWQQLGRDWQ